MANYKKTKTVATTQSINKNIKTQEIEEEIEKTEATIGDEKESKEEPVKEKKVFTDTDTIPCRSIITGQLYIEGVRSKILYTWADYGDVQDIEYRDLIYMVRTPGDRNVYTPRFIIENNDFVEQNEKIKKLYNSLYTTKDLKEIINLPINRMATEINQLPDSIKASLKGIIASMIDDKELDSVTKIKALDDIFGTKLVLTAIEN